MENRTHFQAYYPLIGFMPINHKLPRHLLAKLLLYRIINHIGLFTGCLKRLNRLVSNLFMEFTPIQVFPVHRIIEHIPRFFSQL